MLQTCPPNVSSWEGRTSPSESSGWLEWGQLWGPVCLLSQGTPHGAWRQGELPFQGVLPPSYPSAWLSTWATQLPFPHWGFLCPHPRGPSTPKGFQALVPCPFLSITTAPGLSCCRTSPAPEGRSSHLLGLPAITISSPSVS
jgi:hypothetical protein